MAAAVVVGVEAAEGADLLIPSLDMRLSAVCGLDLGLNHTSKWESKIHEK